MNEWLKLMLDEVRRKEREQAEIEDERERRKSATGNGAQEAGRSPRPADPPGSG
ncbi:MAG TPA: hypothetical protein VMQ83_09485 [Gammaproteobacteria bacterium]|nr:hypothetical protein [Gammaproteobacteria bacterium]